jgi:hypothetical protein
MPADSPESFHRIADVLSRSLEHAFEEVCPERYGASLTLHQVEAPDDQTVCFRIDGPTPITIDIRVSVFHVGGNVYDIAAQVEDEPVGRFTYSEPDTSGSSLSLAPYLGKKVARHLLDEVERCLGKAILQRQMVEEV